ncbi:TPA: hypothetical protein ACH3X3_010553 [Trebouxia sp. C0006]
MAKTRRVKKRTQQAGSEEAAKAKNTGPKTFVFWRGKHGLILKALEADLRKMMSPNTATNLRESKRNVLKDFVHIAGPLGVTQFLILTATENACYLRIAKAPRGPTITMKIHQYSLMKDVTAVQNKPRMPDTLWQDAPLVVMNNFGGEEHLKLATTLFQNLFPAINVHSTSLKQCKRVLLLSYDKTSKRIHLRHFSISAQPSGVSKSVKALVSQRAVPDMGNVQDVSEFLSKSGYGSESEGEDAADSRVTLAQDVGRGNLASRQSRVKLQEIGPRLELEVVKVEEGLCDGKVLFHSFVKKSSGEASQQQSEKEREREIKEKRRKQQEENVRRKDSDRKRQAGEQAEAQGRKKRKKQWWEEEQEGQDASDDDDRAYYKEQVGEDPGDEMGRGTGSQKAFTGGQRRGGTRGSRGGDRGRHGGGVSSRGGRGDFGGRNGSGRRGGSSGRSGGRGQAGSRGGGGAGRGAPRFRGVVRQKARAKS